VSGLWRWRPNRNNTSRFKLIPEKADCEDDTPNDVPLDFLRLTKNDILEEGVDILLTNPDTINYRLINTNAEDEHERFVYEPEFLVFDEVHTYDGLFGSYTSTLMKRIQSLREERGVDDLQLIAKQRNRRERRRTVSEGQRCRRRQSGK